MTTEDRSIVLGPGEGDLIPVRNTHFTFKASGGKTGEAYEFFEYVEPPKGAGPEPHIHYKHDEAFYVLEGEFIFRLGKQTVRAGSGSFVMVPMGVPHHFSNPGTVPARFLAFVYPGGLKDMFHERGQAAAKHGGILPPEVRAELARKYDQHLVTSPPWQKG